MTEVITEGPGSAGDCTGTEKKAADAETKYYKGAVSDGLEITSTALQGLTDFFKYQKPVDNWTEKKVEATTTTTTTTKTDDTKTDTTDAAAVKAGACGKEDECGTTVEEKEIECGAAKLGAGILATLAIAASL